MRVFRSMLGMSALMLFVAAPLNAQARIGLKAGLTSATLSGDVDDVSSRNSVSGGLFLTLPLSPNLSVQPEALYMSKGAEFDADGLDDIGSLKLQYIEIPVLLKYSFGPGAFRPNVFGGPSLAFRTACEIDREGEAFDCNDDEATAVKTTDFGGVVGVGIDYDLGGVILVADARFGFGLTNINDLGRDDDVKNRALTFLAGFSIPLSAGR